MLVFFISHICGTVCPCLSFTGILVNVVLFVHIFNSHNIFIHISYLWEYFFIGYCLFIFFNHILPEIICHIEWNTLNMVQFVHLLWWATPLWWVFCPEEPEYAFIMTMFCINIGKVFGKKHTRGHGTVNVFTIKYGITGVKVRYMSFT